MPTGESRSPSREFKLFDILNPFRFVRTDAAVKRTESAEISRRIVATKIRSAMSVSPRNSVAGFAGVAIGLLGMSQTGQGWQFPADWPLLIWAAITSLTLSVNIVLAIRFNRAGHSDEAAIAAALPKVLVLVMTGACWGSSSWLLLPGATLEQDTFLLAGIALVLMGGAGAQAVYRPLVLASSLSLSLVFVTGLLRLADPIHILLAIGFAVYTALVLAYTRSQEVAVTTAIELGLENQELLTQRTEQERAARFARSVAEQAQERAEKADRSKTNFIAATSHDLRQPMHALVQYVEHLRLTCSDPLSGPTIARIEDSISAMANLLDAVLDFTKISMGAINPDIRVFSVDHLLRSIDSQIRPVAQAKGLTFRVESDGGYFESDEILLERIIRNVGQNAVRYTECGDVVIRARLRGSIVRVLVSDSGIGVPADEQRRIFEEYYQVDNRARDRRKGLGLGLAIVRDLAHLLGLKVRLKSAPGRGSSFAIEVPRAHSVAPVIDPTEHTDMVDFVRGAFVVLIDDDPLALDALTTTLKDFGCRVLAATSGNEALRRLSESEFAPQMVVSDYRLAESENGLQVIAMLIENLRALYGESFLLPALLITGDTSPEELDRVVKAGHPILHKPFGARRLFDILNAALQSAAAEQYAGQGSHR